MDISNKLKAKALKKKREAQAAKVTKNKPPPIITTGSRLDKLKFVIPLLQAITLKKNMRGLPMNYALEQSYAKGEIVKLIEGTKVKYVSAKRFKEERDVYSTAPLDDERYVDK
jgi:hypothetical protein